MSGNSDRLKQWRRDNPAMYLRGKAQARARQVGAPFSLTREDVQQLLDVQGWTCAWCEAPVGTFTGGTRPLSATLDRLIPARGYVAGNVVLACHQCNCAKAEHTPASLRRWADRIEIVIHRMNQKAS